MSSGKKKARKKKKGEEGKLPELTKEEEEERKGENLPRIEKRIEKKMIEDREEKEKKS